MGVRSSSSYVMSRSCPKDSIRRVVKKSVKLAVMFSVIFATRRKLDLKRFFIAFILSLVQRQF